MEKSIFFIPVLFLFFSCSGEKAINVSVAQSQAPDTDISSELNLYWKRLPLKNEASGSISLLPLSELEMPYIFNGYDGIYP
jgi:hypothetical protein